MTSVEASAEIFADSAIVQAGGPKLASPSAKSRPRHAAGPDLSPVPAVIAVETTPVKDATADVSAQSIASSAEGGSASKPKSKFPRRKKFSKSPAKKNSESADEVVNAAVVESAPVALSAPSPTVVVTAAVSPLVSKTVSVPTAAVVEPAVAAAEPEPVPVAAHEEVPSVEAPASDTATNEPVPQTKKANHRKRQPKARKAKAAAATAPDAAASDATAEATPAPAAADAESTSARVGSAPTRGGRPPFSNSNRPRGQPMSRPRSGMYPGNYIPNSRSYPMFNAPVFIPRNFRHRTPQRRDVFSGQMVKFQQDKRQKPEMYKNKNTLACALERTLKQAFPGYMIRLYMVGSSTNGIGDNSPLVEICIMFNKPAPPRSASRRAQSETVTTSSTSDAEQDSQATVASESTSEDAPVPVVKVAQSGDETVASSADESSTETVNASQSSAASATDKSGIDLAQIATVIKNQNFGKNIQLAYCETPYLTFKDDVDNLDVKLYLNADTHIRTTQLIRDYSKLEWRFQHLAMILKAWARENGILSEETIDDLSWSLMVLHYLQVAKARVLPSLQKMVPRRYEPHQAVERLISGYRFTPNWRSSNRSFLRELLTGLFNYYGNEFNYEQYIISVREGKLLDRATHLVSGESHWDSLLCIEEPYSRLNTTRSLTDKAQLESIIGLFKAAFETLTDSTGTEETPKEFALSDLITVPAAATVAVAVAAAPVESQ